MGISYNSPLFLYVGGFFFSLGVFAATRWGFDKWKKNKNPENGKSKTKLRFIFSAMQLKT